jgi:lysophospholipase L1-like esterase
MLKCAAAFLTVFLLCSCGNPSVYSPQRTVPQSAGKVVFIGDSLTEGIPGYPSYATRLIAGGIDGVNAAIGGTTSRFWAQTLTEQPLVAPRLVVLMLGTNDGISAADYGENIRTIIGSVSCPVVLITTPPVHENAWGKESFVETYAQVCRDIDPRAIDLWNSAFAADAFVADGVHFTDSGQEIIYRLVKERLAEYGVVTR